MKQRLDIPPLVRTHVEPISLPGRRLVIIGDGEFAEIAYEYFTHDSPHTVVGFAVEREYLKRDELFGLPVLPFEDVEGQGVSADQLCEFARLRLAQRGHRRELFHLREQRRPIPRPRRQ